MHVAVACVLDIFRFIRISCRGGMSTIRSKEPDLTANLTVAVSENVVMKQRIIPFGLYTGAECLILHIAWVFPNKS